MEIGIDRGSELYKTALERVKIHGQELQQKFKHVTNGEKYKKIVAVAKGVLDEIDRLYQQKGVSVEQRVILTETKAQCQQLLHEAKIADLEHAAQCQRLLHEKELLDLEHACQELHEKTKSLASSKGFSERELSAAVSMVNQLRAKTRELLKIDSLTNSETLGPRLMDLLRAVAKEERSLSQFVMAGEVATKTAKIGPKLPISEAFLRGRGEEVVEEMKMGAPSPIERRVVQGPKNRSEATVIMNEIVSSMLRDPSSVKFARKVSDGPAGPKTTYWVTLRTGESFDLEELLHMVDFSHIQLTQEEFEVYQKLCGSGFHFRPREANAENVHITPTDRYFNDGFNADKSLSDEERESLKALSLAQKFALNVYSGDAYHMINPLMRGQLGTVFQQAATFGMQKGADPSDAEVDTVLKETLLHVIAAHSAVSLLPNYVAPAGTPGSQFLYRGETNLPDTVMQERIRLAREHGISREMGFVSLSHTQPKADFFGNGGVVITREGIVAKNLSALSQYPGEREVLLLPTAIQWEVSAEEIVEEKGTKRNVTFLYGKPVRLIEGPNASWLEYRLEP